MISADYQKCLDNINAFWEEITFEHKEDSGIHIGLPHRFISPTNGHLFSKDQFYWDSYFIILGLVASGKIPLARGMVDNLMYLYKRFGIVPMRNRFYNLGISQIPFLSSMVREVYEKDQDKDWLKEATDIVEQELTKYWLNEDHMAYEGLSRYADQHFYTHMSAEHESGWDMTSRFNDRALDYLPVDLNSNLYKYETDLAYFYSILGDDKKEAHYKSNAGLRKDNMVKFMWNEEKGFFFDYIFPEKKQSTFYSLAGYYPLWAQIATQEQAEKARDNLTHFEYIGGLAMTQREGVSQTPLKQWDYPNGWANQQWVVVKGLLNYGLRTDAKRITDKWLELNKKVLLETGKFWERYNVVEGNIPDTGRYPLMPGFGWTNAIFVKLMAEFYS